MRTSDDLTKLVNQSGFPLQLAVDHLVKSQEETLGWSVLYREHGWKHPDGQSGFIDLVLEDRNGTSVLAIECKRVLEADWLFLQPDPTQVPSLDARLWVVNTKSHGREYAGYFDLRTKPESIVSMYCVVAGQDAKARPMLERVAAEACAATEALAAEELPHIQQRDYGLRMYASVIVTTARLLKTEFDSSKVVSEKGEVQSARHEEQQWVRFRKQLSPDFAVAPRNTDWDFSDLSAAKEKVVFVVNITHFGEFLKRWSVLSNSLRLLMR